MSQLNDPSVGIRDPGRLHKMFQANLLWVNWYDRMMNAEVL